jgi:hypothetical protein
MKSQLIIIMTTTTKQMNKREFVAYGFFDRSTFFLNYAKQNIPESAALTIPDIKELRRIYMSINVHLVEITAHWWLCCTRLAPIVWNEVIYNFHDEPTWLEYMYLSCIGSNLPIVVNTQNFTGRAKIIYEQKMDEIYIGNFTNKPTWTYAKISNSEQGFFMFEHGFIPNRPRLDSKFD